MARQSQFLEMPVTEPTGDPTERFNIWYSNQVAAGPPRTALQRAVAQSFSSGRDLAIYHGGAPLLDKFSAYSLVALPLPSQETSYWGSLAQLLYGDFNWWPWVYADHQEWLVQVRTATNHPRRTQYDAWKDSIEDPLTSTSELCQISSDLYGIRIVLVVPALLPTATGSHTEAYEESDGANGGACAVKIAGVCKVPWGPLRWIYKYADRFEPAVVKNAGNQGSFLLPRDTPKLLANEELQALLPGQGKIARKLDAETWKKYAFPRWQVEEKRQQEAHQKLLALPPPLAEPNGSDRASYAGRDPKHGIEGNCFWRAACSAAAKVEDRAAKKRMIAPLGRTGTKFVEDIFNFETLSVSISEDKAEVAAEFHKAAIDMLRIVRKKMRVDNKENLEKQEPNTYEEKLALIDLLNDIIDIRVQRLQLLEEYDQIETWYNEAFPERISRSESTTNFSGQHKQLMFLGMYWWIRREQVDKGPIRWQREVRVGVKDRLMEWDGEWDDKSSRRRNRR